MGQITNGVSKIEVGTPGPDGTMGTVLSVLGYTNIDSASFSQDEGTTNDFNVEEQDDPLYSRTVAGKKTIVFQVADPDLNTYQQVFGGSIAGGVWSAPTTQAEKEVSIKITPEIGLIISIPRAKLRGRFNATLSKNALQMIDIEADVLVPVGVSPDAPIILGPAVAPTT